MYYSMCSVRLASTCLGLLDPVALGLFGAVVPTGLGVLLATFGRITFSLIAGVGIFLLNHCILPSA